MEQERSISLLFGMTAAGVKTPLCVDVNGRLQIDVNYYESIFYKIKDSNVNVAVADGLDGRVIPVYLNGYNLYSATASLHTAGATNGTTDIQIRRRRDGADVDMLSTKVTIATTDYTASDGVVDTANDDLLTGDLIYVDVDAITGTAGKGLCVTIILRKPLS